MEKFYKFLDGIQKAVNISEIERGGFLPDGSIAKHFTWRVTQMGWPLPKKHIAPLFMSLCKTFKVVDYYGAFIRWDDEIMTFFIEMPRGEPDEVEERTDHFVYRRKTLYKDIQDHHDLVEWLQNQEKH